VPTAGEIVDAGQLFESGGQGAPEGWIPDEDNDAYMVRAELPGMKTDDVNVELRGNELRISGEVKDEETGKTLRRRHGKFAYRTTVPTDADVDKIDAQLADGILTVRLLPKKTGAQSRTIDIRS
jgi:HSP20 family protein